VLPPRGTWVRAQGRPATGGSRPAKGAKSTQSSKVWRVFNVDLGISEDPGKDSVDVSEPLLKASHRAVSKYVARGGAAGRRRKTEQKLPTIAELRVVRKSFDARVRAQRKEPCFSYVVDVTLSAPAKLVHTPGSFEAVAEDQDSSTLAADDAAASTSPISSALASPTGTNRLTACVVGAGPAGLFAALELARAGWKVTVMERGQPVERRGRDIGALFHRRNLDSESNLCFGEGGAGTWSDGKLTTRIGRNSDLVRRVLQTLVDYGAPPRILVDNKPHLGTDRMVRILQNMRQDMQTLGVEFHFGTKVQELVVAENHVAGVKFVDAPGTIPSELLADHVVLAVGHSARELYEDLLKQDVALTPKGFAVGFRVEHPQEKINSIQYKQWAGLTQDHRKRRGYGTLPVADYRLTMTWKSPPSEDQPDADPEQGASSAHCGRAVYSFCMCPGGQIVPTSITPDEVCVNGMSFSKRSSKWANSALVVTVDPADPVLEEYTHRYGALGGVEFQRAMEQRAAAMGGGNLSVPVQRVIDFLAERDLPEGENLPESSYRLGTRAARLDQLYPESLTRALAAALRRFDEQMPGFACPEALLHGVETRTSAPLTIERDSDTLECVGLENLWPAGEGAGYAGGIVSAAVDGLRVSEAMAARYEHGSGSPESGDSHGDGTGGSVSKTTTEPRHGGKKTSSSSRREKPVTTFY